MLRALRWAADGVRDLARAAVVILSMGGCGVAPYGNACESFVGTCMSLSFTGQGQVHDLTVQARIKDGTIKDTPSSIPDRFTLPVTYRVVPPPDTTGSDVAGMIFKIVFNGSPKTITAIPLEWPNGKSISVSYPLQ